VGRLPAVLPQVELQVRVATGVPGRQAGVGRRVAEHYCLTQSCSAVAGLIPLTAHLMQSLQQRLKRFKLPRPSHGLLAELALSFGHAPELDA